MVRLTVLACVIAVAGIVDANPRSYTPAVTWSPSDEAVVEGAAEYAWEHSQEYQEMTAELAHLRGVIEGMRIAKGEPMPYRGPGTGDTWTEGQPQTLEQAIAERDHLAKELARQHELHPPQSQGPPQVEPQPQAILYAKCSSCHSGDTPAKGFIIEPGMDLGSDEAALKVVKILRKTYNGEMPVDGSGNPHPLSDEEYGQLQHELLYNGN